MSFWGSLATKASRMITDVKEDGTTNASSSIINKEEETHTLFNELSEKFGLADFESSYNQMKSKRSSTCQSVEVSGSVDLEGIDTVDFTMENISKVCLMLSCVMYELEEKENQLPIFMDKLRKKKTNYSWFRPEMAWLSKMNVPTAPKYCIVTFEDWPLQVVAIRGTRMTSAADWTINLDSSTHFYQKPQVWDSFNINLEEGRNKINNNHSFMGLHRGFCSRAHQIPSELIVEELGVRENNRKVCVFTGHSMGGAVASILALPFLQQSQSTQLLPEAQSSALGKPLDPSSSMSDSLSKKDIKVFAISFGSPSFLHQDFLNEEYKQLGNGILRFHYEHDFICPSLAKDGFEAFETSICLQRSGNIHYHSPVCSKESESVRNTLDDWSEGVINMNDALLRLSELLTHHSCTNYYDSIEKSESMSKQFVQSFLTVGQLLTSTSSSSSSSTSVVNNTDSNTETYQKDIVNTSGNKKPNLEQQLKTKESQFDETKKNLIQSSLKFMLREAVDSCSEKLIANVYSLSVKPIQPGKITNSVFRTVLEEQK